MCRAGGDKHGCPMAWELPGGRWRCVRAGRAGEAAALGNQRKEREGNTVCEAVHPGNFLSLESQQAGVSSLGRQKQSLRQGFRCT